MLKSDHQLDALLELDQQIDAAEDDAIKTRWEFGRQLLAERVGKQLPAGRLDEIAGATGKPRRELGFRMQFAERYKTVEELGTAVQTFRSWTEIRDDLSGRQHVENNSGETEWYTPESYILAARAVMGGIDLDPCSTEAANAVVGATVFYTKEDDGLSAAWKGRIWMNPPYRQPDILRFCERLADAVSDEHVEQACVLINNATETAHFQRLAEVALAICFPTGRISFWHPDRESAVGLQGQAILYFGSDGEAFRREFLQFGFIATL